MRRAMPLATLADQVEARFDACCRPGAGDDRLDHAVDRVAATLAAGHHANVEYMGGSGSATLAGPWLWSTRPGDARLVNGHLAVMLLRTAVSPQPDFAASWGTST
jgi:hypothetical protein